MRVRKAREAVRGRKGKERKNAGARERERQRESRERRERDPETDRCRGVVGLERDESGIPRDIGVGER